jgi:hypothetical protein
MISPIVCSRQGAAAAARFCMTTRRPSTSRACSVLARVVEQTTRKCAVARVSRNSVHKVRIATKELREAQYSLRAMQLDQLFQGEEGPRIGSKP